MKELGGLLRKGRKGYKLSTKRTRKGVRFILGTARQEVGDILDAVFYIKGVIIAR